MLRVASDCGPHARWVHGRQEAWMLLGCWFVRLCSVCWGIFSESIINPELLETVSAFSSARLRHFLPAVQLCFLQRLAQEVAEQLDNGWESWQLPFFEAYVPPSDSQLLRFLVSTRFKSWNHCVGTVVFNFEIQGGQRLDQCFRKECGAQSPSACSYSKHHMELAHVAQFSLFRSLAWWDSLGTRVPDTKTQRHRHASIHANMHTFIHAYIHAYIYIHTRIHIYSEHVTQNPWKAPHSTLHSLYCYGNTGNMYKTVETICFAKTLYVTAFGFVGSSCFTTGFFQSHV